MRRRGAAPRPAARRDEAKNGDGGRPAPASSEPPTVSLPVRAAELLEVGVAGPDALTLETRFGNADLFSLLDALGVVGPFTVESPWELRAPDGRHLIHAGGYAAVPFGERYPPLTWACRSRAPAPGGRR